MRQLKWIASILLILIASVSYASAQEDSPSLTRIGRGAVQSVQWHPDGDYILTSTVTGAWLYTPELQDLAHIPEAKLATLSPDGRTIAGVDDTGQIRLWDANTFLPTDGPRVGISYHTRALAWSPDGRYLAAAVNHDEDLIYVWDFLDDQKTVFAMRYSADKLLWSPEGRQLAMLNTESSSFYIFNMEERKSAFNFRSTDVPPDGSNAIWQDESHILIMTYGENTDFVLWNILTGEQVKSWYASSLFAFPSNDGDSLAIGVPGGLRLYRLGTDENINVETRPDYFGTHVLAWSHDDRWLAAGAYNFSRTQAAAVMLIDPQSGDIVQRFGGAQKRIQLLVWSPDNRLLLTVDDRQQLFVYAVSSGETFAYTDAHTLVGDTLAWRSDSSQFLIADSLGNITLWDEQQAAQLKTFSVANLPITHMQWQPNGDLMAIQAREINGASILGELLLAQIWDTRTGENVTDRFGFEPDGSFEFFDWHPDGSRFATMSEDKDTLIIQNVDSGDIITAATFDYSLGDIQRLVWSPSGKNIVALTIGYGSGGSYVYGLDKNEFTLSSAYLLYGTTVWTHGDELVSLRWGSLGDPTPPRSVMPTLQRHAELYYPGSGYFGLRGLTTNTRQGFLSPNGNYAAAVDDSDSGMVWDATNGEPLAMLSDVAQVVWSPDETRMVLQRSDASLWLLDAQGTIRAALSVSASSQEPVGDFFWSPDSHQLAHLHHGVVDLWRFDD